MLAVLSLRPSGVPLQHSLLACRGSLRAIGVIQHPTLQRILHVGAFCVVDVVLPLSRTAPVSMFCFTRPDCYALVKGDNTTDAWGVAERQGVHNAV